MEYVDSLLIMEDDDDSDSGNANAFSEESAGVSQDPQTELTTGSGGSQHPHSEPTPAWCKCRECHVNRWLKRLRINVAVTEIA